MAELTAPRALSEIGEKPSDRLIDDSVVLVPPLQAEAPLSLLISADAVPEAPSAPEVIDVLPDAPRVSTVVVIHSSGFEVSLRVRTSLRSVSLPAFPPIGALTPHDAPQLDVQIPPSALPMVPPA